MEDRILDGNKAYVHEDTKALLEEVRGFFQGRLKMVGIEWTSEKKCMVSGGSWDGLTLFLIKNAQEAPFERCTGLGDVNGILSDFEESLFELRDNIDALVDNNQDLDEDSKDSLEFYAKSIDNAVRIFGTQQKRRMPKINELSSVGELKAELKQLISEIIVKYVIEKLIDALYTRVKNGSGEIYELVIAEVNNFLAKNGVVTKEISVGEVLNPEDVTPTLDSADNVTDDFAKFETIEEIRRYPYIFKDGTKIADGVAKIWRSKE